MTMEAWYGVAITLAVVMGCIVAIGALFGGRSKRRRQRDAILADAANQDRRRWAAEKRQETDWYGDRDGAGG